MRDFFAPKYSGQWVSPCVALVAPGSLARLRGCMAHSSSLANYCMVLKTTAQLATVAFGCCCTGTKEQPKPTDFEAMFFASVSQDCPDTRS